MSELDPGLETETRWMDVHEPEYKDAQGAVRRPNFIEHQTQILFEAYPGDVKRYIDPATNYDVERFTGFRGGREEDSMVTIERWTEPNGTLLQVILLGYNGGRTSRGPIYSHRDGSIMHFIEPGQRQSTRYPAAKMPILWTRLFCTNLSL